MSLGIRKDSLQELPLQSLEYCGIPPVLIFLNVIFIVPRIEAPVSILTHVVFIVKLVSEPE